MSGTALTIMLMSSGGRDASAMVLVGRSVVMVINDSSHGTVVVVT